MAQRRAHWIECGGNTQEMKLQGSESDSGATDGRTEQCGRYPECCGDTCQEMSLSDKREGEVTALHWA